MNKFKDKVAVITGGAQGIGPLANHNSRKPIEETVTYL